MLYKLAAELITIEEMEKIAKSGRDVVPYSSQRALVPYSSERGLVPYSSGRALVPHKSGGAVAVRGSGSGQRLIEDKSNKPKMLGVDNNAAIDKSTALTPVREESTRVNRGMSQGTSHASTTSMGTAGERKLLAAPTEESGAFKRLGKTLMEHKGMVGLAGLGTLGVAGGAYALWGHNNKKKRRKRRK